MTGLKLMTVAFIVLFMDTWAFRDEKPYYKWSPITFSSGHKKFGKDLYRPYFVPQQQWTPFSASQYSNSPSAFSERIQRTRTNGSQTLWNSDPVSRTINIYNPQSFNGLESRSCAKQGSSCASTVGGRWECCDGLTCEMIRDRFGICLRPSWKTNNMHPIYKK